MITLELPDGTLRPTTIDEIDSIRVARGGSDLPELRRLGVIVTYTDGTRDAVVGTFAEVCAKIAAAAPKPADLYLLEVNPGHRSGRGRWWGPNRQGYTDKIEHAGLYTADESNEADCTSRTVASVLEELEAPARALRARV